jgi:hypothetical protein
MNYLVFAVLLVAAALFGAGILLASRVPRNLFWVPCALGSLLAVPGVLFAVYYLKMFQNSVWFYEFRSIQYTELTAGGAGFLAGLLHQKFSRNAKFRRIAGRWFFPGLLGLGLLIPYIKPMVRPLKTEPFQDRWSTEVCLQTSESSCGPACAATLLRRFGQKSTEAQIARECFTSRSGTEAWYLARMFRKRGLNAQFSFQSDVSQPWPCPSIAGVRLPQSGNTGHFITILERREAKYVIGDPLSGVTVQSQPELRDAYDFTGFFMAVR